MKVPSIALVVVVSLAHAVLATPGAPDGRTLAAALSAERLGLGSGEATLTMEMRDRAGRIVSRSLRARTASGDGWRKMRLTFESPADQRGVELLVSTRRGEAPDQFLWLPRSAELRRIAASDRGGSFQGSDFAFSDFEDQALDQADIQVVGRDDIAGLAAWRLEISPRPGAAPGPWSKVIAWIADEARVPLKVQFFRGDVLARALEVKRLQPVGGRLMPTRLVMSDLAKGSRTTLDITALDAAARFPEAIFRPEALGR